MPYQLSIKLVDKHAPVRIVTRAEQKQFNKPWLTTGILKSIKKKQRIYRTHFVSKIP